MKYAVFSLILPEFTLEEQLELLRETGYDSLELRICDVPPEKRTEHFSYWGNHRDPIGPSNLESSVERIRTTAKKHKVGICALAPYGGAAEPEKFEPVAKAAAAIGAKFVRVMAPWRREEKKFDELFSSAREGLRRIADIAGKHKVTAAMEIHHGSISASASGAKRLVEGLDPSRVGVTLDPGNMAYEGMEDWKMACELLGPHLIHVHVKNAYWVMEGKDPTTGIVKWKGTNAKLREGVVDWREVMAALRSVGYDGHLTLEDFTDAGPREKLADSIAFLKSL